MFYYHNQLLPPMFLNLFDKFSINYHGTRTASIDRTLVVTVVNPDLQIRGGGDGHPAPETRGGWPLDPLLLTNLKQFTILYQGPKIQNIFSSSQHLSLVYKAIPSFKDVRVFT